MWRVMNGRFRVVIVMVLFLSFIYPANCVAEQVQVNRAAGQVTVDALVTMPSQNRYSTVTIRFDDPTKSIAYSADALAKLLFKDQASPRHEVSELDPESRWGGSYIRNEEGEEVSVGQGGTVYYSSAEFGLIEPMVNYLLEGINNPEKFFPGEIYSEESLDFDLPFAPRMQVTEQALALLQQMLPELKPQLIQCFSIDHSQMASIHNALLANSTSFKRRIEEGGYPASIERWGEEHDAYLMRFRFSIDGLPIYDAPNLPGLRQLSIDQLIGYRAFSIYAEVVIMQGQVNQLTIDVVGNLGDRSEASPILTYEQALNSLESWLGDMIHPAPIRISKGYLQYIPVPSSADPYICTLTPTWCFESDIFSDSSWFRDTTYCVNAITGEELR